MRRVDIRVNVDLAFFTCPPGFLGGSWMQVHGGSITGADIAAWPSVLASCASYCLSWYFALACRCC